MSDTFNPMHANLEQQPTFTGADPNLELKNAVGLWCNNPTEATSQYGHISNWNVSNITNMSDLFGYKNKFNDDISRWDVSHVTNMKYMFSHAHAFNQPIGNWNVSKVKDMNGMFLGAKSFNQPISEWNVSNVTNMTVMFHGALEFKQNLKPWILNADVEHNGMFSESPMDSRSVKLENSVPGVEILPNFPTKGGKKTRRRSKSNRKNSARSTIGFELPVLFLFIGTFALITAPFMRSGICFMVVLRVQKRLEHDKL